MSVTEGRGLTRFETVIVAVEGVVVVGVVGGEVVVALMTVVAETGPVILGGVVEVEGVEAVLVCVNLTLNCLQKLIIFTGSSTSVVTLTSSTP